MNTPHTATASDRAWTTADLARGEEAALTFAAAGDYPYFCRFHPHMKGAIAVRPG